MKTKEDLERRKLELEIADLGRAWWKRPAYLGVLIPIVLGTLTFFAGILSGFFDRERTRLKHENQSLERENTALLAAQDAIRQASAEAQKRLDELNAQSEEQLRAMQQSLADTAARVKEAEKLLPDRYRDKVLQDILNKPTPKQDQKK